MDKQLYDSLMDTYRARRELNARIEQQRRDQVFAAHPDVAKLCTARHEMIMGCIRAGFQGAAEDPVARMEDYNRQIRTLLAQYGYAPDYLSPVYECPLCQDTGLVGQPIKTVCECFRKKYMEVMNDSRDAAVHAETFETFDPERFPDTPLPGTQTTQRRYMHVLRRRCEEFADAYPGGNLRNLVLHGSSGLGKTFLMRCILDRQTRLGREALYVTAYQLLNDLRGEYFRPGTTDTAMYEDVQLLLIDDLGMEPLFQNVTVEVFFNLLNQRTMKGLGTVVSTNLSLTELKDRYTERFTSRLLDKHTSMELPFLGKDIRLDA